jgi:redox-sensing transcriptional repressor
MNYRKTASPLSSLSVEAFRRMPYYLRYLKELLSEGTQTVSAPAVALHFGYNEVQVRKDFAAVSSSHGKPRAGFNIKELIEGIEGIICAGCNDEAALVGVGSLGRALLQYGGFEKYGLNITVAFDKNDSLAGEVINGKFIYPACKISEICRSRGIKIGIITVPADEAQVVCYQLLAGGVLAVWNFAPVHLTVPDGIIVQNENLASSLALLSKSLHEKIMNEGTKDKT